MPGLDYFKDNVQTEADQDEFNASQYYYNRDDLAPGAPGQPRPPGAHLPSHPYGAPPGVPDHLQRDTQRLPQGAGWLASPLARMVSTLAARATRGAGVHASSASGPRRAMPQRLARSSTAALASLGTASSAAQRMAAMPHMQSITATRMDAAMRKLWQRCEKRTAAKQLRNADQRYPS